MQQAFDTIAREYDVSFTNTLIGTAQRNIVRKYLEQTHINEKKLNVLELNCGTGEDALWFGKNGHNVLATDISESMLAIAQKKINDAGLDSKIRVQKLDINKIDDFKVNEKFDLIFSNFGGINCIYPDVIKSLPAKLKKIISVNGHIVIVIMSSFCLWETIYFFLKLNFKEAFRRFYKEGSTVNLNGTDIKVYYYSPAKMKKIFAKFFISNAIKPVGFFLPPSYLEKFFYRKPQLFKWLNNLEKLIHNHNYLSGFSDHYLVDLQS
jgi:ubiquinone/menaquinone biosynthesis C-methylase UbiE